jgi:hypothetical protein
LHCENEYEKNKYGKYVKLFCWRHPFIESIIKYFTFIEVELKYEKHPIDWPIVGLNVDSFDDELKNWNWIPSMPFPI